jgi:hypothetical protein
MQHIEKKYQENSPICNSLKKYIIYLRIILTKEAKDFYNKNYKTLKTLEDRRTSHVHGLTELIL